MPNGTLDQPTGEPNATSTPAHVVDVQEAEWIVLAIGGDLKSFNCIVARHQQSVLIHCTGILRDSTLAEDVTQDTFIKAWRGIATFKGDSIRSWLMRIATNSCLDLLRQRSRQPADSLDAQLTEPEARWSTQVFEYTPEQRAEQSELAGRLEQALAALPDDQRIALLMSDVLGYGYQEIADFTDSAIGTIKSRISRARAKLRADLLADERSREHFERYARS